MGTETTSTPAGTTQTIRIGGAAPAKAHRLDDTVVRGLLGQPARSLTLWQAAHVVAWLHQTGRIALRPLRPGQPVPLFEPGRPVLKHPGPNPDSNDRFTVSLEEHLVAADGRKVGFEIIDAYAPTVRTHVQAWRAMDVRLVVVLHHLVAALEGLEARGLKVVKVLHAGCHSYTGTRVAAGKNKAGFDSFILIGNHGCGRAIDWAGVVLEDADGQQETFTVLQDWGQAEVPLPAEQRGTGPDPRNDRWPVFTRKLNGSNWVDVNWKVCDPATPQGAEARLAANAHDRAKFLTPFYRLQGDLPAAEARATTRRQRAALLFLTAFEAFYAHCTHREEAADDATVRPPGALGTGPSAHVRNDHPSLLHPESAEPVYRETHRDHIHAQVGHYGHEYPDPGARLRDVELAKLHVPPTPKDGQVWEQPPGPANVSKKGEPPPGAVIAVS